MRVDMEKEIRVHVPLHFINEDTSSGVKAGGRVAHNITEVEVVCLPTHLPEFIEVDVSGLNVGESLHLKDLPLPETGSLVELARGEGHDLPVVSIHARRGGGEGEEGEAAEGGEEAAEGES
jgi:large subunit ribosomal protein L25